jgi:hypothetical protein
MQSIKSIFPARAIRRFAGAAVFAAALTFAAAPAHAQDKATLDLLVKKGLITQAEADDAAKSAAIVVNPKEAAVKKLQLEGMLQVQYDWLTTQDKGPVAIQPGATNQFSIRRAYLGAIADLGNGWGGEILMDFAAGAQAPAAPQAGENGVGNQQNFEKAVITKKIDDYGTASAGFQKVQWDQEENTPSSQLKTIERSVATNYFDNPYGGNTTGRLGFGNRHTGLYWSGLVPQVDGLYYGAAVTNGIQSVTNFGNAGAGVTNYNEFAFWGNLGYGSAFSGLTYKVGVNVGYAGDANSEPGAAGVPGQNNSMWGYNPYVTLTYSDFTLAAEFLQVQVQNGRVAGAGAAAADSKATPYGINLTPSYKINDQWEIAAKYSYLETNGRGTTINPVDRNANNVFGTENFNRVWEGYLGVNYYIIGTDVKLSAGYEYDQFYERQIAGGGNFNGPRANVQGVRTQLQVLF